MRCLARHCAFVYARRLAARSYPRGRFHSAASRALGRRATPPSARKTRSGGYSPRVCPVNHTRVPPSDYARTRLYSRIRRSRIYTLPLCIIVDVSATTSSWTCYCQVNSGKDRREDGQKRILKKDEAKTKNQIPREFPNYSLFATVS
ncbi:hypothetical protein PUN28_012599 [Cardiocondyla obscurior]|uniref:Uncharacterized protein n=1 Tax=Cardiocondyla obscurior TaxID=286306 RepID=A0AAW2FE83_9HYME